MQVSDSDQILGKPGSRIQSNNVCVCTHASVSLFCSLLWRLPGTTPYSEAEGSSGKIAVILFDNLITLTMYLLLKYSVSIGLIAQL